MDPVIESRYIQKIGKAVLENTDHLVHAASGKTCGILTMDDVDEELGGVVSGFVALARNFVSDAPEDHRRVVAELVKHVHHVFLRPFVKEEMVAVAAFLDVPLVEWLYHHHESHLVAKSHKFRGRHVVGSADGVAAHLFEQSELVTESGLVDGAAQGTQVMVVAYAPYLAHLAVEEESLVRNDFDGTDTESGGVFIYLLASIPN